MSAKPSSSSPRLVALRELAAEAELERRDFLYESTEQLRRFLDQLYADPSVRGFGHRVAESVFEKKHTIFLRERMGPDLVFKP